MSRRVPIVPTILVIAAALLMMRLGVWQLHRLHEKEALLARYSANIGRPPIAFPTLHPATDDMLYRRSSGLCREPVSWQVEAGRSRAGATGWRHIALCRTGAAGPGLAVDMGVSQSPAAPAWRGGQVHGRITWRPSSRPLIARLFAPPPAPAPMIVSDIAAPGLEPTAPPDPSAIPNNHLSYAVQWFIFAALALIVYALALRRRGAPVAPGEPRR